MAFADLVRLTHVEVWRACAALVDAQSADDLVQETYLRAHRSLPRYAGDSSLRTWLLSIARHVCVDEIRARTRHRRLLGSRPPTPAAVDPARVVDLELLIESLLPERREAFVLTQLLGLSYGEAAAVSGCPVGTIRSRVARARADLIAAMSDADVPAV